MDPAAGCDKGYEYRYRCCEFADAGVDLVALVLLALIVYVG